MPRPSSTGLDGNAINNRNDASSLGDPLLPSHNSISNEEAQQQQQQQQQQQHTSNSLWDGLPLDVSILIKSLYFLDALGSSTWGRFSAIYYNLHGLNSYHIGLIEGIRTAIPTLSQVLWGVVADRCHSQKRVWLLTKSISTLVLLTLALPIVYESFWNILAVSIGAQLFVSDGVLDAYTLNLLGTTNKMFYGRYRLYASLSWGLGSIVMGVITDHFDTFEPNFILFGILALLMVTLVAFKIPDVATDVVPTESSVSNASSNDETSGGNDRSNSVVPTESQSETQSQDINDTDSDDHPIMELLYLAARPRVAIFLLEVIIMGAAMATVERLLFLYLVNDLQASTVLCGLSVGVNVLFELPIFWHASFFMKALGHDGMFLLAMACFVVRVVGYTMLTPSSKWLILPLEVLHGITFACFWIVSTDISKVLVHQTKGAFWRTAIPSTVQMLYSAVGVSLGSVVGGWAMDVFGSRTMYKWTAGIVGTTWTIHLVGSIVSRFFWNGSSFLPDYADLEDEREPEMLVNANENTSDNESHEIRVEDPEAEEGKPARE